MNVRDSRKTPEEMRAALEYLSRTDFLAKRRELDSWTGKPVMAAYAATRYFRDQLEILLLRYSLGERVDALVQDFPELLSWWEFKLDADRRYMDAVLLARTHNYAMKRDIYQHATWMVCFGILFNVSDEDFARVVASVKGVDDRVLDRLIATRVPDYPLSQTVLWPRPFALLEAALDAPAEQRPALMLKFVKAWYPQSRKVYWWGLHMLSPEVAAKYFGYWCVEAAAAVAAFDIDDRALVSNEYYPADLVPARGLAL